MKTEQRPSAGRRTVLVLNGGERATLRQAMALLDRVREACEGKDVARDAERAAASAATGIDDLLAIGDIPVEWVLPNA